MDVFKGTGSCGYGAFDLAAGICEDSAITAAACIGVCVVCAAGCGVLFHFQLKKGIDCLPAGKGNLVFWEEVLFLYFS